MKKIEEYTNYDDFLNDYRNYNEKQKYYSINKKGEVLESLPSYILEIGYMYINKKFSKIIEILNFEKIYVKKEKKISRMSNCDLDKLEDRFFRALFNRDSIHIIRLGNELIRRDKDKFFDIMYINSKISVDSNRLIKLYLFELIYKDLGLKEELLVNLLNYFTKSKEGYLNYKEVDELYKYIYEIKFNEKIEINKSEMIKENQYIYEFLKGE